MSQANSTKKKTAKNLLAQNNAELMLRLKTTGDFLEDLMKDGRKAGERDHAIHSLCNMLTRTEWSQEDITYIRGLLDQANGSQFDTPLRLFENNKTAITEGLKRAERDLRGQALG